VKLTTEPSWSCVRLYLHLPLYLHAVHRPTHLVWVVRSKAHNNKIYGFRIHNKWFCHYSLGASPLSTGFPRVRGFRMNYFLVPKLSKIKTCQNSVKYASLPVSAYHTRVSPLYVSPGALTILESVQCVSLREGLSFPRQSTCLSESAYLPWAIHCYVTPGGRINPQSVHYMPLRDPAPSLSQSTSTPLLKCVRILIQSIICLSSRA
jgi:hypothetical protein